MKKTDEISAMRRCKYSQGKPPLLRFAPSLTLIASVFFFNELLTHHTRDESPALFGNPKNFDLGQGCLLACLRTLDISVVRHLSIKPGTVHKTMKQSRRARLATALIALISVLFVQLAAAAYACPGTASGNTSEVEMAAVGGHMDGCDETTDTGSQALCFAQSQEGRQSLDKPAMPDLSQPVAVLLIPSAGTGEASSFHLASPHHVDAVRTDRTGSPPLTIRNCCFRI